MKKFKIKDLQFTYNHNGIFTHIDLANKQDKYYLDINKQIPLVFCKGEKVKPYFRTETNISEKAFRDYLGGSESLEHYNTKMGFCHSKFMVINDTKIVGYTAQVEYRIREINKIVDVAFFDEFGDLLIAIEVLHTNPKSYKDIIKFNQINTPIYEYNINTGGMQLISCGDFKCDKRREQRRDSERIVKGREYIQRLKSKVREDDENYEKEKGEIESIKKGVGSNWSKDIERARGKNEGLTEDIRKSRDDIEGARSKNQHLLWSIEREGRKNEELYEDIERARS